MCGLRTFWLGKKTHAVTELHAVHELITLLVDVDGMEGSGVDGHADGTKLRTRSMFSQGWTDSLE